LSRNDTIVAGRNSTFCFYVFYVMAFMLFNLFVRKVKSINIEVEIMILTAVGAI
jgi:hypothetical protein